MKLSYLLDYLLASFCHWLLQLIPLSRRPFAPLLYNLESEGYGVLACCAQSNVLTHLMIRVLPKHNLPIFITDKYNNATTTDAGKVVPVYMVTDAFADLPTSVQVAVLIREQLLRDRCKELHKDADVSFYGEELAYQMDVDMCAHGYRQELLTYCQTTLNALVVSGYYSDALIKLLRRRILFLEHWHDTPSAT